MSENLAAALADFSAGKPVLVADSFDRENEVDAIVLAAAATAANIGWMVRYTSGYLCAPMRAERAERLELPAMVRDNQDPKQTAYTVSCDAAQGVTTGISAADRARTLRVLADPDASAADLIRPGHVLPLRGRDGGVFERAGHTEAAIAMCELVGAEPVAAIGELVHDDGSMMRVAAAIDFAAKEGLQLITIEQLAAHLRAEAVAPAASPHQAPRVQFISEARLPTRHGTFQMRAYLDNRTQATHLAIIAAADTEVPLVRIHSECLTGEALGSLRCDCGPQLDGALAEISKQGGIVIYLRGHEGRGIGLAEKVRAYALQDQGLDTASANTALGWPVEMREYGAAAAILTDLNVRQLRLMTNNPEKTQLHHWGLQVSEVVPLEVGFDPHNTHYLHTKQEMGHTFKTLDEYIRRVGQE